MTRSIIYKSILALIIFGFHSQIQGQDSNKSSIKTWISIGTNFPTGKEFSEVHSIGLNGNIYLNVINFDRFNLGPAFNINYHLKYLNEAAKDQLINPGIGLNGNYSFSLANAILYFGVVAYYESLKDKISPRKDFQGEDFNILSGSGVSYGPKISLKHEKFIFQLGYLIRIINIKFDEDVTSPFTSYNELYEVFSVEENITMSFSSLNISIGYEF